MDGKTPHGLALAIDGGHRARVIQGHRELWDYLERHPNVPTPNVLSGAHEHLVLRNGDTAMIAAVDCIAGELGVTSQWRDGRYTATRVFGGTAIYSAVAFLHAAPAQVAA